MNKISIQSPTRVDLAGGTLDLWPLYNFVGGATTINVAIDIKTTAELIPTNSQEIELESEDLGIKKKYKNLNDCIVDQEPSLLLLRAQLKYWQPRQGFRLKTSSESPVGGGLGGSSSLTISLMKAFSQFCQKPFSSVAAMVHAAHNIEAEVLNTPTGTQDYYPAASGGVNILRYSTDGIHQEVYSVENTPLESHFVLVYTGKSHHSGLNNFEVLKSAISKEQKVMDALHELKLIAEKMTTAFLKKDWNQLPDLFQQEYGARIRLAPAFSSPEIKALHRLSLKSGAQAVKICGAGGGGCVMLWVPPENRERVSAECQKAGFRVLDAKPVSPLKI
jgi:D-glycero-alpha-D-manno-heptose-7-phosphate kinase